MEERSAELQAMYEARRKLTRLVLIQEEQEYGKVNQMQTLYGLTQGQVDDYNAARLAEKQQLITELVAMMNAYLTQ